ncbi:MAG: hypothetical protein MZU97_21560 [Bacillus subtilis]|nr:hypothetical protein [Bacillus subtilis]
MNPNDPIFDWVFRQDHHIMFTFDWSEIAPHAENYLRGSRRPWGCRHRTNFRFTTSFPSSRRTTNSPKSKVVETFIASLKRRIDRLEDDLSLYIPFRHRDGKLWASVSLERISEVNGKPKIVFGRIHQLSKSTPKEIIHYQRTYQDSLTRLFTRETLKAHFADIDRSPGNVCALYGFGRFQTRERSVRTSLWRRFSDSSRQRVHRRVGTRSCLLPLGRR